MTGVMTAPDPAKPVLFRTTRNLWWHRTGYPLVVLAIVAFVLLRLPSAALTRVLEVAALPGAIAVVLQLVYAFRLRAAGVTEEGLLVRGRGSETFVRFADLDWATEVVMKPPTLVVRTKRGVPGAPDWFLLVPPRVRGFGLKVQPLSEYVAQRIREERAAHPDRALEYSPWPSRLSLTLKVQGVIFAAVIGALFLSLWYSGHWPSGIPRGPVEPIEV